MTGFLKFVGLLNAAVWFGAAVLFTFGVGRAPFSEEMKALLGPGNYPYYSGAIAQVLIARYFHLQFVCGSIALLHTLAEWLYLGKAPQRLRFGLLIGLCSAAMIGGLWLQPKLKALHATKYNANAPAEAHAAASRSFRVWHSVSMGINLLLVGGLGAYVWHMAHPPDQPRFMAALKFRS